MYREGIIWGHVQQIIKNKISKPSYETWIKHTKLERVEDLERKFVVTVPNESICKWIEERYKLDIEEGFLRVTKLNYQAEFVVDIEKDTH